jgi:hypothetical protein
MLRSPAKLNSIAAPHIGVNAMSPSVDHGRATGAANDSLAIEPGLFELGRDSVRCVIRSVLRQLRTVILTNAGSMINVKQTCDELQMRARGCSIATAGAIRPSLSMGHAR